MQYHRIPCKSAIHHIKNAKLPYALDLNIYRGCEHRCQYCFAAYSHQYINDAHYFDHIYIKENIADVLDKELAKKRKKEVINIGGICDSYQPIEAKEKMMPSIWKIMIKHQNPVIISTKSTLIERDIEYIKQLSQVAVVNVACTITIMDESTRQIIEPHTSTSMERFRVLKRIKDETNAIVGVHIMPIIPKISDSLENLQQIYTMAHQINADYVLPGTLHLKGITKQIFFTMVHQHYPHLYQELYEVYTAYANRKQYKQDVYAIIRQLEKQHNLHAHYMKVINEKKKLFTHEQLSLF